MHSLMHFKTSSSLAFQNYFFSHNSKSLPLTFQNCTYSHNSKATFSHISKLTSPHTFQNHNQSSRNISNLHFPKHTHITSQIFPTHTSRTTHTSKSFPGHCQDSTFPEPHTHTHTSEDNKHTTIL